MWEPWLESSASSSLHFSWCSAHAALTCLYIALPDAVALSDGDSLCPFSGQCTVVLARPLYSFLCSTQPAWHILLLSCLWEQGGHSSVSCLTALAFSTLMSSRAGEGADLPCRNQSLAPSLTLLRAGMLFLLTTSSCHCCCPNLVVTKGSS